MATVELPRFGLYYDFRNPPAFERPFDRLYREVLEQAAWAERQLGFRSVWISEHHFVDDGYTPSPLTLAGALAASTERMRLGTSIVILPLQDPVRLAEDALTVDAISGGRFALGVGLGYRPSEFAGFGVSFASRRARLEEGLSILRAAFDGRPIAERGGVRITPGPLGPGRPELWVGGFAPAAIERAVPIADGMLLPIPELWPRYADSCAKLGRRPRVAAGYHWIVAADPEAELNRVAPYLMHQVNEYGASGAYGPGWEPVTTAGEITTRTPYQLLDADGIARQIVEAATTGFVEDVHWWTIFPGEPIEWSNARLHYFVDAVVPRVRALLADRSDT